MKTTIKIKQIKTFLVLNLFAILVVLVMFSPSWGAIYYVDSANGNDSNPGTSQSAPWKTIAKVNSSSFQPGDYILLQKGKVWREQLIVPSSGSPGNPITFGAYGAGDNPVISGANFENNWIPTRSDISQFTSYYATGYTYDPNQVFEDGVRLTEVTNKVDLVASSWWWDDPNDRVYIRTTGDENPSGYTIEISVNGSLGLIYGNGKDYITIDGIKLTKGLNRNLLTINDSDYWIVQNVTAEYAYLHNLHLGGTADDFLIDTCDVSYAGQTGINVTTSNVRIRNSIIHHNAALNQASGAGIHAYGSGGTEDILIEQNYFHNNGPSILSGYTTGVGIWIDGIGDTPGYQKGQTIIRFNLSKNDIIGIMIEGVDNAMVYYNVIVEPRYDDHLYVYGAGIFLARYTHSNLFYNNTIYKAKNGILVAGTYPASENNVTNNVFKNNIVSDWITRALTCIRGGENDGTYGYGNVYEYNCFGSESSSFIRWGGNTYFSTYDDWETAYGATTNSIEVDPLMVDPGNADFTLMSTSSCIDAGVDVGLKEDYVENPVPFSTRPDIGAYEYFKISHPLNLRLISK